MKFKKTNTYKLENIKPMGEGERNLVPSSNTTYRSTKLMLSNFVYNKEFPLLCISRLKFSKYKCKILIVIT